MVIKMLENMSSYFGPLFLISMFAIFSYLLRNKIFTLWELRIEGCFWPNFLIKYREHTRVTYGRTEIWFYVAIVSLILTIISAITSLVIHLSHRFFGS